LFLNNKLATAVVLVSIGIGCGALLIGSRYKTHLTGKVTEETGEPVSGAEVIILGTEGRTSTSVWTNPKGDFEIHGLPVGEYRLEVQKRGFKPFHALQVPLKPWLKSFVNAVVVRDAGPTSWRELLPRPARGHSAG
jgi:hypothetical protein